jgi:hypothetical protein
MTPEQGQLMELWLRQVAAGHWLTFLIGMALINIPGIAGWLIQWLSGRTERNLWKMRCADKDAEIARLAAQVKRLENLLLKTKR